MYTQLADWHGPGPWILLIPLVWIAVVILVIAVLRRTVRRQHGCAFGGGAGAVAEHPLAVLGRRYAEGDIDAEEYRAKRAVLSEPPRGDARGGGAR
ncbi:SHOCT domain-containing protein [Kitasatospora sp. NPDC093102]|uniref:SHOCT domain-containing protein n=1 Tax=Kitasatospora sp. NPDC093102 TaxID=3155069 RepID=UPI003448CAFC